MRHSILKQQSENSVPHYSPRACFLNKGEITVYEALCKVFNSSNGVFAKVWLAELVARPKPDGQNPAHWRRVQRRRLDFLVCSESDLEPILAIKLETELDSRKRRMNGPDVLEEVLQDIGLPLLRLRIQHEYDPEDLIKKINFTMQENQQNGNGTHQESPETNAFTTVTNLATSAALKSALGFWTNTKEKYRMRTSQRIPRETPDTGK